MSKYIVKIEWGSVAHRGDFDGDGVGHYDKPEKVEEYKFPSKATGEAFLQGVEAANGWLGCNVVSVSWDQDLCGERGE